MNLTKHISKLAIAGVFTLFFETALVADDTKRDNSQVNVRDRGVTELTADDQKMDKSDTELIRQIRKDINDRAGLSTYAKNVKIISDSGQVTLKGPVRTQAEKNTVASIASRAAGAKQVHNELEIVPME